MKKFVKILLVLTLTLGISLCLCSCIDLDEIRETRVSYVDKNKTQVEFLGNTYKQLDTRISEYLYSYSLYDTAYAVEDEVPLLLTSTFGKWVDYSSTDTRLIKVEGVYYCREDLYDYATDLIEKNEFDYFCVEEYDYETDKYVIRMLDESLIDTVDEIIQTVEPLTAYPETYNTVSVMATDKSAMFMHNIFWVDELSDGGYCISMENLAEDIYGYRVPEKYESEFAALFPEETDEYFVEDYYEEDYYEDDYTEDDYTEDDFKVYF